MEMVDSYLSPWHVAFNNGDVSPIIEVDIQKYMDKVSNATFKTVIPVKLELENKENYAKIFYKNTRVFDGYVHGREYSNDGTASVRLEELSFLLWDTKCQSDSVVGLFQPEIRIDGTEPWSGNKRTIGYYIDKIINDFNKSGIALQFIDLTNGELTNRTSIIGQGGDSGLPTLNLTHMSIFMALKRVIMDWCGKNMWFDIRLTKGNTLCGVLYAGSERNKISGASIPLFTESKKSETQQEVPATMVYVRCNNGNQYIRGVAGTDPKRAVTYEVEGAFSEVELNAIAQRVLEERQQGSLSFEVTWNDVEDEYIIPEPADVFDKIGDMTLIDDKSDAVMPWNTYVIREVSLGSDGTKCVIGDYRKSIFDIYKTTLASVDGASSMAESKDIPASYGVIEVEGSTASSNFKGWKALSTPQPGETNNDPNAPSACGNGGGRFLIDDELKLPASTDNIIYVKVDIGSPRCNDPSENKFGDAYTDPYNREFYTSGRVANRSLSLNLYKGEGAE